MEMTHKLHKCNISFKALVVQNLLQIHYFSTEQVFGILYFWLSDTLNGPVDAFQQSSRMQVRFVDGWS